MQCIESVRVCSILRVCVCLCNYSRKRMACRHVVMEMRVGPVITR